MLIGSPFNFGLLGMLAAVNGANMRVLVINLTSPEARGASIALLGTAQSIRSCYPTSPHCMSHTGFVNCIGRGFGPLLLDLYMSVLSMNRREALQSLLNLWLLSGALICLAARSLDKDEERVRATLRRIADEATVRSGGQGSEATGASTSASSSSSSSIVSPVNFERRPQHGSTPLFAAADRERSNKLPGYLL